MTTFYIICDIFIKAILLLLYAQLNKKTSEIHRIYGILE